MECCFLSWASWKFVDWLIVHRRDRLSGRQRHLIFFLTPVLPFFVRLAFFFHLSVSFGERVLIFTDDDPPVSSAQLSAIGLSRFP